MQLILTLGLACICFLEVHSRQELEGSTPGYISQSKPLTREGHVASCSSMLQASRPKYANGDLPKGNRTWGDRHGWNLSKA